MKTRALGDQALPLSFPPGKICQFPGMDAHGRKCALQKIEQGVLNKVVLARKTTLRLKIRRSLSAAADSVRKM